ncbi:MAG TPA: DHA2 family efflux MFS transporter permease subunit, partial [Parvularculaceae bacterium]|nr:DHA2 family efflux MFS transporter permease subunit [Parvularculaceae bacterium]
VDRRKLIVFAVMVVGMFMAVLDIQIVAASIPQMQAGLAASPDEISWVQTAYLIAAVIMIPATGYLSRALSTRVVYCISVGGFTLASLGCALSWNLPTLTAMRALQGFIGGATMPTVFAVAFTAFPRGRQGPISAAIGLIVTLAPTIGPTLGGWISDNLSWHWLFLINVPPGIIVVAVVWLYGHFDEPDLSLLRRIDARAFIFMAAGLGLLQYVLEEGPQNDWFDDRLISIFSIVAAVSLVAFTWRSLTSKNPLVDLKAYGDRNFTLGSIASTTMGVVLYGLIFILPLYLARVRGLNALQIGETLAITGVAMFVTAPISGYTSRTMDPRIVASFGFVLAGLSTYSLSKITPDWGFWQLFWPQVERGAGMMLAMAPLNVISLGTLPPLQVKNAAALYNLTRNLGGAIGLAFINTFLSDRTDYHARILFDQLNPARATVSQQLSDMTSAFAASGAADPAATAVRALGAMAHRQAAVLAYADVLHLIFWISMATAGVLFFVKPPASARSRQGAGGE